MYSILSKLQIIEASSFVASPTAGLYLAQMGAEVVRVDQVGGGPDFRRWPLTRESRSLYWENLNRAKKSVALDLGRAEGRELLQELVRRIGQFVTNFPVSGFLGHDVLRQGRDDLVTVRIMGMADGGPALDYTVNCAVGYPLMTGPAELGEAPVNHVLPAWDLLTGAYAAFAMMVALKHRDETGQGQEMRIPLSDVAIGSVANLGGLAEVLYTGGNRERLGNTVFGAFGRDFVTGDGKRLMILAVTARQWRGLVEVLGIAGQVSTIERERGVSFASDEGLRFEHRDALFPLVEGEVRKRDYVELKAALDSVGGCYGPYQSMRDAAGDETLVTSNPLFGQSTNPSGFSYPAAGPFLNVPTLARMEPCPAPELGQHSEEVLTARLGLSSGEFGRLVDAGIVGLRPNAA